MSMGWDEIERVDGFSGLKAHAEARVLPILSESDLKPAGASKLQKRLGRAVTIGFFSFAACFIVIQAFLPDNLFGGILRFLLFPVLFFGCVIGALYFVRRTLLEVLLQTKRIFFVRGRALTVLAEPLGLSYVATPGGIPGPVKWLMEQSWAPAEIKAFADPFDEAGGMDEAVAAARDAGLMVEANVYVIGSAEQKEKYQKMAASQAPVEDGFHGRRSGIDFEMFEWIERVEKAPDIHHLVIVLEAPLDLHGITQLRARRTGWPQEAADVRFLDIDLGPRAFGERYRLRSTDQVEARQIFNPAVIERVIELAHDGKFRAVAKGRRLVFDFPGPNRFNLVDLMSGEWSEESLRQTASDLAEALALVETLAHAFMLAAKSDTGGA
ncbi:MAG: DUF3137 domain-containing protein [Hyphomonas sp.]